MTNNDNDYYIMENNCLFYVHYLPGSFVDKYGAVAALNSNFRVAIVILEGVRVTMLAPQIKWNGADKVQRTAAQINAVKSKKRKREVEKRDINGEKWTRGPFARKA